MHEHYGDSEGAKKFRLKWIVLAVFLLFIGLFLYQLLGPDDSVRIARETTFITEPLTPEGLPDYASYLLAQGREGVTPENNAAVLFWRAIWPGDLSPQDQLPLCAALGIQEIPDTSASLTAPYDERGNVARWFAQQHRSTAGGENNANSEQMPTSQEQQSLQNTVGENIYGQVMSRPWRSEQIPPMATWVERNKVPLDLLNEAASRDRYWSPSPSLVNGHYAGVISMLLTDIQGLRGAARGLSCRAMWHVGEGHPEQAWRDLHSIHRFARFLKKEVTLVGQLVAIALDGIACKHTVTLLHHANPDPELARQVLVELTAMGPASDIGWSLDQGERIMFLDAVIGIATNRDTLSGLTGTTAGGGANWVNAIRVLHFNWNYMLEAGNRWYDQLVAAVREPTREERQAALKQFDNDVTATAASLGPARLLGGLVSSQARTELLADVFASLMLPALQAAHRAEERGEVLWQMTRVAAALAVYRAEQGEYPDTLDALVPDILAVMPLDVYSGQPFLYERKPDGGYLLYSVFENGKDDGASDLGGDIVRGEWKTEEQEQDGTQEDRVDYNESDMVIRVPVPSFQLPEWPQDSDESLETKMMFGDEPAFGVPGESP